MYQNIRIKKYKFIFKEMKQTSCRCGSIELQYDGTFSYGLNKALKKY